jgi:hypothetical protein
MSRLGKDELPFRLVDMSMEELYREIEDFEIVEPIPSEPESEVEESDTEEATYFENQPEICMSESDDDSDSESDLPLASLIRKVTPIVTPNITQAYSPPTWSNTTKPTAPPIPLECRILYGIFKIPRHIKSFKNLSQTILLSI